eukprot:6474100-Amphidinium_carterae.1
MSPECTKGTRNHLLLQLHQFGLRCAALVVDLLKLTLNCYLFRLILLLELVNRCCQRGFESRCRVVKLRRFLAQLGDLLLPPIQALLQRLQTSSSGGDLSELVFGGINGLNKCCNGHWWARFPKPAYGVLHALDLVLQLRPLRGVRRVMLINRHRGII